MYPLLSRTCNRNKFENSSKERIDFLLEDKWNDFFKKNVDVEHTIIAKMFEGEVTSLFKGRKDKQIAKKRMIVFGGSSSKFFSVKYSFKKSMLHIKNCQEQFTNLVCGEHVVETFNFAFASKNKFPFKKVVFKRDIAKVS